MLIYLQVKYANLLWVYITYERATLSHRSGPNLTGQEAQVDKSHISTVKR